MRDVTVDAAATTNYAAGSATLTISVTQGAAQSVTLSGGTAIAGSNGAYTDTVVFPGTGYSFNAVASDGGTLTYSASGGCTIATNGSDLVFTGVANSPCVITVDAAATTNYAAGSATLTISVTQGAAQSVTLSGGTAIAGSNGAYTDTVVFPGTGYSFNAVASDGGTLTYSASGGCTIATNGSDLVFTGVANSPCVITVDAAATTNYAAGSATLTISVTQGAAQSVTLSGGTAIAGSNGAYTDTVVFPGTGYSFNAVASDGGTLTYSASGGCTIATNGSDLVFTGVANSPCVITVDAAATTNYAAGSATLTISVTQGAAQSVTLSGGTAIAGSNGAYTDTVVFPGTGYSFNAVASDGGTLTYSASGGCTIATNGSDLVFTGVANSPCVITVDAAATTNYAAGSATLTISVTQGAAQSVTLSGGTAIAGSNGAYTDTVVFPGTGYSFNAVASDGGTLTYSASGGCTIATNGSDLVFTGVANSPCVITVDAAATTNYAAGSATLTISVTQGAAQSVTLSGGTAIAGSNGAYTDTVVFPGTGYSFNAVASDGGTLTYSASGGCTIATNGSDLVFTGVANSPCVITVDAAATTNYAAGSATLTISVTQGAAQSVTLSGGTAIAGSNGAYTDTVVFPGTGYSFNAVASDGGTLTYSASGGCTIATNGSDLVFTGVANSPCVITVDAAATTNYAAGSATLTLSVTQGAAQSVTLSGGTAIAGSNGAYTDTVVFPGTGYSFNAVASDGGTLTYSASGGCTIATNGSDLVFTGVANSPCVITVDAAATTNYAAGSATLTISVTQGAAQSVTLSGGTAIAGSNGAYTDTVVFPGTGYSFNAVASDGGTLTYSASGGCTIATNGSDLVFTGVANSPCVITVDAAATTNYAAGSATLTISVTQGAAQSVTLSGGTAIAGSNGAYTDTVVFPGTGYSFNAVASDGGTLTYSASGGCTIATNGSDLVFTGVANSPCVITVDAAATTNYAAGSATLTISVTQGAAQSVTLSGGTAIAGSNGAYTDTVVFPGTGYSFNAVASDGGTLTYSASGGCTIATNGSDLVFTGVANSPCVITVDAAATTNYAAGSATLTISVTQGAAQSVTLSGGTAIAGSNGAYTDTVVFPGTGYSFNAVASDGGTLTYSASGGCTIATNGSDLVFTGVANSPCVITVDAAATTNYAAGSATLTISVTQGAAQSVTLSGGTAIAGSNGAYTDTVVFPGTGYSFNAVASDGGTLTYSASGGCTIATNGSDLVFTGVANSPCVITVDAAATTNYAAGSATLTISVTQGAAQSVTLSGGTAIAGSNGAYTDTVVFPGTGYSFNAVASDGGTLTYSASGGCTIATNGSDLVFTGVANSPCVITVDAAATTNYAAGSATLTISVTQGAAQSVTLSGGTAIAGSNGAYTDTVVFPGTGYSFNAVASDGGTLTYSASGGCTIATNGSDLVFTGVANSPCVITVDAAATTNYAAGSATLTISVTQGAAQSVTLSGGTAIAGSNGAYTDTVVFPGTGYSFNAVASDGGTLTYSASGGCTIATNGSDLVFTGVANSPCVITVDAAATTNYAAGSATLTISVTQGAAQSVTLSGGTAIAGSNGAYTDTVVFPGTGYSFNAVASDGGTLTYSASGGCTIATNGSDLVFTGVANSPCVITVDAAATTNYAAGSATLTISVTQGAAQSVTLSGGTAIAGSNGAYTDTVVFPGTGYSFNAVASDGGTLTYSASGGCTIATNGSDLVFTGVANSPCVITVDAAATTNYAAGSATLTISVTQGAAQSVTLWRHGDRWLQRRLHRHGRLPRHRLQLQRGGQ